jgi:hypothetical protein
MPLVLIAHAQHQEQQPPACGKDDVDRVQAVLEWYGTIIITTVELQKHCTPPESAHKELKLQRLCFFSEHCT